MAKARRLQTHWHICYWITGEKLSPDRVNPLIDEFTKKLRDFKIEEENYIAAVSCCGDSIFQEVDTRKLKCSSHLTFEIIDTRPSADANLWGLGHCDAAAIHRGLQKLTLTDGKYTHRVDFVVKDTVQASEPPMSRPNSPWPERRF